MQPALHHCVVAYSCQGWRGHRRGGTLPDKRPGARQPVVIEATQAADPPGTLNEARWAEVLGAAAELFAEKGYAETTVQDIATRAGLVNKGSLYYYINTKEDLLWQLALQLHEDMLSGL